MKIILGVGEGRVAVLHMRHFQASGNRAAEKIDRCIGPGLEALDLDIDHAADAELARDLVDGQVGPVGMIVLHRPNGRGAVRESRSLQLVNLGVCRLFQPHLDAVG